MSSLDLPFLDLFQRLQAKGMALSPEQYDLLRQALGQGFGLENWSHDWSDLRDLCRVLWVKPSPNYDQDIFERIFSEYVQQKQREIHALEPQKQVSSPLPQPGPARQLPKVPPRKMPISQPKTPQMKAPVAVQVGAAGLPDVDETGLHLTPTELPLSPRTVSDCWQFLRRPLHHGLEYELDLEATIASITQQGYFSDVVMRPVLRKQAELLLLVDDSNVMLPFAPALQPWVKAIAANQLAPAQIYRFTTYPDDYLHDWKQPSRAILLSSVLARLHPRRTIVMLWSEAGATTRTLNAEHRAGLLRFLVQLSPCVRNLIWLNPLPSERWVGTLAQELAHRLDGRMIHLEPARLLYVAKQPASTDRFALRALT
jgi:uncharacterized protein